MNNNIEKDLAEEETVNVDLLSDPDSNGRDNITSKPVMCKLMILMMTVMMLMMAVMILKAIMD